MPFRCKLFFIFKTDQESNEFNRKNNEDDLKHKQDIQNLIRGNTTNNLTEKHKYDSTKAKSTLNKVLIGKSNKVIRTNAIPKQNSYKSRFRESDNDSSEICAVTPTLKKLLVF